MPVSAALLSSPGCVKIENARAFKPHVPTPERGNEGMSANPLKLLVPGAGIEPAPRQAARDFELITGPFGKVSHYRQLSELTGFFISRLN